MSIADRKEYSDFPGVRKGDQARLSGRARPGQEDKRNRGRLGNNHSFTLFLNTLDTKFADPPVPWQHQMSTTHALIPELEEALRHVSVDRYAESIQRVADFFLAGASRFNEEHVHLFDRILGRLIVAVETKVLAELARRLAPVRNAPRDVIRRLARNGEIAVAGPVLARSTRLDDADLVETARTQGQAHRFAISGR